MRFKKEKPITFLPNYEKSAEMFNNMTADIQTTVTEELKDVSSDLNIQVENALTQKLSSNRRKALGNILYNVPSGTTITTPGGLSLTKLTDTPGGLWRSSDGRTQYSDDWIRELSSR